MSALRLVRVVGLRALSLAAAAALGACDPGIPADADGGLPLDAAPPPPDAPGEPVLAAGVTLDGLALFQGTRVALFEGGASSLRNAPIVAGRRAVVRAYLRPGTRAGQTFTGQLEVREGDRVVAVLEDARAIPFASDDAAPASVLSFALSADLVTPTASYAVRLVEPGGLAAGGELPAPATPHPARLPRDGSFAPLGALDDGAGMHVVLVPLRWDGDGSGRLPDTSPAQLERFRALLTAVYPLVDLRLEVREVVPYSGGLTLTGNADFDDLNARLLDLRAADGAPPDAYYYGLVSPEADFDTYCGRSCVTGQSYVVDTPADADYRVGAGVGFPGEDTAWTMVHELGHELGRTHAPCDAGGADPGYPYDLGALGVWGFDPRTDTFLDPDATTDFMGYCDPVWTSDYTWSAVFDRTLAVSRLAAPAREERWLVRLTDADARLLGRARLAAPRGGGPVSVVWLGDGGRTLGWTSARALDVADADARLAVLPAPPEDAVAARVDGHLVRLAR